MTDVNSYNRRVPVGRFPAASRWLHFAPSARRCGLAVALATFVIGGCGSSHVTLQRVPSSTARVGPTTDQPQGSGTSSAVATDNGQDPAILSAYQGSLVDFNVVANKAPVQGNDLALGNHMTGDKLLTVEGALVKLSLEGQFNSGSLTSLHARVTQFNGSEAVVESCELDNEAVNSLATGQVVTPASNSTELVNELVQLTGSVWKVARGSQVREGCS